MSTEISIPAALHARAGQAGQKLFLRFIDPAHPEAAPALFTFEAFETLVRQVAAALSEAGVGPGDRVLLLAENSPAWQAVSLAAQLLRAEPAALFASLDKSQVDEIARRVRPKAAFVSTAAQWVKLESAAGALGTLRLLVGQEHLADTAGVPTVSFDQIAARAPLPRGELERLVSAVGPEDPFLTIFTSGTTGKQKGVRIPQRAMVASARSGAAHLLVTERDDGLLFLPFAHVAAQCQFIAGILAGHPITLCSRRDDIQRGFTLGPTYTLSVPLIYERIREGVLAQLDARPRPIAALLRAALDAAGRVASGAGSGLFDRPLAALARLAIGPKLSARMGGRIRFLYAGGAPSSSELVSFFRGLGFEYLEVYGMSETAGMIASNRAGRVGFRPGSVGRPSPPVECQIGEDGEILVRGEVLMSGYLETEDDADAFTADRWFRTGDLGRLDQDGYLMVTGRKKAILVLSTGKKVSPEPLELRIASGPPFAGAVLLGDGEPFVAAALFVTKEDLQGAPQGEARAAWFLEQARRRCQGFAGYEMPKRCFVIEGAPQDFPAILTPTFKIKRPAFAQLFSREIAAVYRAAPAGGAARAAAHG